jgi:hypothetical protein
MVAHIITLDLLLMVAHINKCGPPTAYINGNFFLRLSCKICFNVFDLLACIVSRSVSFGFAAADGCLWLRVSDK